MEIIYRTMTINDYEKLITLWKDAKLPYKPNGRDTYENIAKQLHLQTNRFFVAEYQDKLIGSIIASHNLRKGWINRLAVHPDFRHKGIASHLISMAENFFMEEGIGIFAALVEDWNTPSLELFKKVNYIKFEGVTYYTKRMKKDI